MLKSKKERWVFSYNQHKLLLRIHDKIWAFVRPSVSRFAKYMVVWATYPYINESQYKCLYILLIFILSSRLQITHSWTFKNEITHTITHIHLSFDCQTAMFTNSKPRPTHIRVILKQRDGCYFSRTPMFCVWTQFFVVWFLVMFSARTMTIHCW